MKRAYGIAGNGRASSHLQAYFRLLKTPYKLWHRRCRSTPEAALVGCSTVFILISDGAIARFIAANPFLKGKKLIHFSGSLHVRGAFAMHPFMPLSARTLALAEYRRIPFALEPGTALKDLVPDFSNPVFTVNKGDKKLYHALCALGANLPVMLWQKALLDLNGKFGIPHAQVLRYFRATLENFRHDPARALTGPICRGDKRTVASDINALDGAYAGIYSAFAKIYENN
ncbi:MAG: DUF2520 domain-containing protein [Elusimicrobia bacterium]|nr:DUF2520 domain-containing protein [Elusimicrobiota bacterium]